MNPSLKLVGLLVLGVLAGTTLTVESYLASREPAAPVPRAIDEPREGVPCETTEDCATPAETGSAAQGGRNWSLWRGCASTSEASPRPGRNV